MGVAQNGIYWPFKTLLQGSGISLSEDATTIRITNTGGVGGGSGDMLSSEYAPSGIPGKVDHAILADTATTCTNATNAANVPWSGVTGIPTSFPTDWSLITSKPTVFPPATHGPTHRGKGSDPIGIADTTDSGLLNLLSGRASDYVGGDNAPHPLGAPVAFLTAAYNLATADNNKYLICSGGSWVLGIPAPAVGLIYRIRNNQGIAGTTGTITLQPSVGTIDGLANLPLLPGQEVTIFTDGVNWSTFGRQREVVLGTIDTTASSPNVIVLLPVGYRYFVLDFTALLSTIDNTFVSGVVSTNGGSTWITSGYYDAMIYNGAPTGVGTADDINAAAWTLLPAISATPGAQGRVVIYPGSASQRPSFDSYCHAYMASGAYVQTATAGGFQSSNGTINALRFAASGGNLTRSFLTVKGIV